MKMLWNNFKVAFAMYSKIPMPAADWDKESMKYAMCFFPWIGLVIGLLEFVCWKVLEFLSAGELFRAAVMVLIPVVITGGIHLDGFLDTMDALSSWREKERRLEILKDPHAGAFAIIMGGFWFVACLGAAGEISARVLPAFCCLFWISRCFSALSVLWFPNASPKGTAAAFGKQAQRRTVTAVMIIYLAAACLFLILLDPVFVTAAVVEALVWMYYRRMSGKYFGGITGDLAGWFVSVGEAAGMIWLALCGLGMEKFL